MSIEVIFVSLVALGAVIWIISKTVAKHCRSEFQKIFGVMPSKAKALDQIEVTRILDEIAREIIQSNERRPAEDKGIEALDIWQESHGLILMRFEKAKALARRFRYYVKWDFH